MSTNIQNFNLESIKAAQIVYDTATSPITLLFSGGLDGEFMIRTFQAAKIPFNIAIISYGDYNAHDTKYAFDFCSSVGITPIVVDIDIDQFIKSGRILEIATNAKCCAYQMPSIMEGLLKLDGTLIMANGEPYLKNYNGRWMWQETERVNSYMNWYKNNKILGTPDFLRYTPEVTLSFLQNKTVVDLVNNLHPGKLSTRTSKHKIYSENYDFLPRPKYTGWEEIEKTPLMNNEVFLEIEKLKINFNGQYEIEYYDLIKNLQAAQQI